MSREISHLWREVQAWLDSLPYAPSQAKLAERLGLKSRTVISDWKYGASRPTPEHLHALAREMELTQGPDVYARLLEAVNRDQGYILVRPHHGSGKTETPARAAAGEFERRRTSTKARQLLMELLADDRNPELVKSEAIDLLRGGLIMSEDVDAVFAAAERASERNRPKAARKMVSAGRAARVAQDEAAIAPSGESDSH